MVAVMNSAVVDMVDGCEKGDEFCVRNWIDAMAERPKKECTAQDSRKRTGLATSY
jgi:hypothetical protein